MKWAPLRCGVRRQECHGALRTIALTSSGEGSCRLVTPGKFGPNACGAAERPSERGGAEVWVKRLLALAAVRAEIAITSYKYSKRGLPAEELEPSYALRKWWSGEPRMKEAAAGALHPRDGTQTDRRADRRTGGHTSSFSSFCEADVAMVWTPIITTGVEAAMAALMP